MASIRSKRPEKVLLVGIVVTDPNESTSGICLRKRQILDRQAVSNRSLSTDLKDDKRSSMTALKPGRFGLIFDFMHRRRGLRVARLRS